jgi:hypothetical protein
MNFGRIYWIQAPEFDDIGYFGSLEEAKDIAESEYEPFITACKEAKENGELDE